MEENNNTRRFGKMRLYYDLIEKIPEFKDQSVFDEEDYIDTGISPLRFLGSWLNESSVDQNDKLIQKICSYLNYNCINAKFFDRNVINELQVELFWVLDYPTINYIKQYLDPQILEAVETI